MSHHAASEVCLGLALSLATAVSGQYATATEPSAAVVAKYDKDNDQTLDWAEVQTTASARFDRLNHDADRTLDTREVKGGIFRTGEKACQAS